MEGNEVILTPLIKKAEKFIQIILGKDSSGHDYWHCIRVKNLALKISDDYDCDKNLVAVASILHDADDKKIFKNTEHKNLNEFCRLNNIDFEYQKKIIDVIDFLSLNKKDYSVSIETQIVQDADNLDALGAIGIARMFAFGGANGKVLYNGMTNDSFSHFNQRLINLLDLMNTPYAKKEAERRIKYMQEFMTQFNADICTGGYNE